MVSEHSSSKHDHLPDKTADRPVKLMSDPSPVVNDQIPPGYLLFKRDVHLINGNVEPAFYSTHDRHVPNPQAWEQSSQSIIEGFTWALLVPEFADNETADDDRTQEIGNMMSYAITRGLTEEQVLTCYRIAFDNAKILLATET